MKPPPTEFSCSVGGFSFDEAIVLRGAVRSDFSF